MKLSKLATGLGLILALASPANARLLGAAQCTSTLNDTAPPEFYAYNLNCPDDTGKIAEMTGTNGRFAQGTVAPKSNPGAQYAIQYVAAEQSVRITAVGAGSKLPTGSKGRGKGTVLILGEAWRCAPSEPDVIEKTMHATAESVCERGEEVRPLPLVPSN